MFVHYADASLFVDWGGLAVMFVSWAGVWDCGDYGLLCVVGAVQRGFGYRDGRQGLH